MEIIKPKLIVLTGGPCSGKSTLLEEFKGYPIIEETARELLKKHRGGLADKEYLPMDVVSHKIYDTQLQREQQILETNRSEDQYYQDMHTRYWASEYAFLDRSLIDAVYYPVKSGIKLDRPFQHQLHLQRYDYVFMCEVAPKHQYQQDSQRKETYEQAVEIEKNLRNMYRFFGYEPIMLPFTTVKEKRETIENIVFKQEEKKHG